MNKESRALVRHAFDRTRSETLKFLLVSIFVTLQEKTKNIRNSLQTLTYQYLVFKLKLHFQIYLLGGWHYFLVWFLVCFRNDTPASSAHSLLDHKNRDDMAHSLQGNGSVPKIYLFSLLVLSSCGIICAPFRTHGDD